MNYSILRMLLSDGKDKIQDSNISLGELINELIAEEFIQWYQYYSVYQFLTGTQDDVNEIAEKFKEWADDELNDHATKLIARLNELGLEFKLQTPESWAKFSTAKFEVAPVENPILHLQINKKSEKHAIERYKYAIDIAEINEDYTTSELFKHILADEEQHYSEILDFLKNH